MFEESGTPVMVHIDNADVRTPCAEQVLRRRQVVGGLHDEQAVIEGQLDQVDEQGSIVQNERATGAARLRLHAPVSGSGVQWRGHEAILRARLVADVFPTRSSRAARRVASKRNAMACFAGAASLAAPPGPVRSAAIETN